MSSIDSNSIKTVLNSLNDELKRLDITRELHIFGSGALMLLNISSSSRFTEDTRTQEILEKIKSEYEKN